MSEISSDRQTVLCRECHVLQEFFPGVSKCIKCNSHKIIQHIEINTLKIAHIDCDAFYASVEQRDNPSLKERPLVVGGAGDRGVVLACCYKARASGVRSAMPIFKARRLCPDAAFVAPRMKTYAEVSRAVRRCFYQLTPAVEPISIDEAFLDMSGTERLHKASPAVALARMAKYIFDTIGITVSVGLSYNKYLAKIASTLDKPAGFAVLGQSDAPDFLKRQPVTILSGVGKVMADKLASHHIRLVSDLLPLSQQTLEARYGPTGRRWYYLSRGQDLRPVKTDRVAKSISAETTFSADLTTINELSPILWRLSEKVAHRLRQRNLSARTLTMKLKNNYFKNITRSTTVEFSTNSAFHIYDALEPLLWREAGGQAFRLIGVSAQNMVEQSQDLTSDLFEPADGNRRKNLELSMDDIRAKFGRDAVFLGRELPFKHHNDREL